MRERIDGETLLDRPRRRMDLPVRSDHQMIVVTCTHEPYSRSPSHELPPDRLAAEAG